MAAKTTKTSADKKKDTPVSETAAKALEALDDLNSVPSFIVDTEAVKEEEEEKQEAIRAEEIHRNLTEEGKKPVKLPKDTQPVEDWRGTDYTYFPGSSLETKHHRAFDRNINKMRKVGVPEEYVYQWESSDPRQIAAAKARGWKFALYDGGNLSGLADGGFQGTDLFEKTVDGRILNGDVYLMYMPVRKHLEILKRLKKDQGELEQKPTIDYMNDAYELGIRGYIEDSEPMAPNPKEDVWGNRPYNPDARERPGKKVWN